MDAVTFYKMPMVRNHKLARSISDAAWGELKLKVQSVAEKLGLYFVEVDPKNSSRQCHKCGHIEAANRQKERFFCLNCNHLEDSDIQAAKNLLNRGLKQLGIDLNHLPMVRRKVTPVLQEGNPPQRTGGTASESIMETSSRLLDEPSNPDRAKQLSLFNTDLWSASSVMN